MRGGGNVILQDIIGTLSLIGIALVTLVFVYVLLQAGKPADETALRKSARTARVIQG